MKCARYALLATLAVSGILLNTPTKAQNTTCAVSKSHFLALHSGMTYREAVKILGCEGDEVSRSDMAGFATVMYAWKGSIWSGANMNAMFQNDQMITKAQMGLTD
jgi:hypothetical protein